MVLIFRKMSWEKEYTVQVNISQISSPLLFLIHTHAHMYVGYGFIFSFHIYNHDEVLSPYPQPPWTGRQVPSLSRFKNGRIKYAFAVEFLRLLRDYIFFRINHFQQHI